MVGELGRLAARSWPLQKCTEYWPEEQVVYDGVEITVQKVIHTEDYRLRLISLRVRPGAARMGARALLRAPQKQHSEPTS